MTTLDSHSETLPQQWQPWLVATASFGVLPLAIVTMGVSAIVMAISAGTNKNTYSFFNTQVIRFAKSYLLSLRFSCGRWYFKLWSYLPGHNYSQKYCATLGIRGKFGKWILKKEKGKLRASRTDLVSSFKQRLMKIDSNKQAF